MVNNFHLPLRIAPPVAPKLAHGPVRLSTYERHAVVLVVAAPAAPADASAAPLARGGENNGCRTNRDVVKDGCPSSHCSIVRQDTPLVVTI